MVNYPTGTAQEITFATLCEYFDQIASRKPRRAGTRTRAANDSSDKAAEDFMKWANHHLQWPAPKNTGKIIFRLLFPEHDIRRVYNIKEARLAKHLAFIHDVGTLRGQRGEALYNWKSTTEDQNGIETGKAGCLGLEVQDIRKEMEDDKPPSLKLSVLDRLLDELAVLCDWSNLGKHPFQKPYRRPPVVLQDIYRPLSARESAYITQIILKDLRPLLYPIPSLSVHRALMEYDSKAFQELIPYSMMKAWHWAMPRIYRAKADYDKAADLCDQIPRDPKQLSNRHEELLKSFTLPQLGTPVNIPKAIKASGPCLASPLSKLTGQVWAEIKMDGERMQIHVDRSKPEAQQIQIFSKSHRDSTKERAPTHELIRAALGLPSSSPSASLTPHPRPTTLENVKSGIFEAEMVAWNMSREQVDEFWRINELKLKPWQKLKVVDSERDRSTSPLTESQIGDMNTQDLSDRESRHLALCFFDVIYLNGQSLLECSYNERRRNLEQCIHVIPNYSMLVDRKSFDLSHESAKDALRKYYATVIAERHEGLVIKTAESIYNDSRIEHKWLKVKKDYLEGFGDAADYAVIGAAWDQKRARELGVPTSTFTSWYIGLCDNSLEVKREPSLRPNFQIVFLSHSYGLTRKQLENVNQVAKDIENEKPNSPALKRWPFTYQLHRGLEQPKVIFKKPLVFELMGSGFTKCSRYHEYELRWPRILKVHHPQERDWTSAIDLETHNEIAKRATDPSLLRVADIISGGSQERAENGFQAELEHWIEKLRVTDSRWLKRSNSGPEICETLDRPIASKPVGAPSSRTQEKLSTSMTSNQPSERSAHAAPSPATLKKLKTPAKCDIPEIIEIPPDDEPTSMKTPRKQTARASPQSNVSSASRQNSALQPFKKRKASGSPTALRKENPSRQTRLLPFVHKKKTNPTPPSKPLDSDHREGPDAKRRKTSDGNRSPAILPDKVSASAQAPNQDVSKHRKATETPGISKSDKTPEQLSRHIEVFKTPSAKKSPTQAQVTPVKSTITPKHNYLSHDLLDFEKIAIPVSGGFGGDPNPLMSPTTPTAAISNDIGSSNLTPGTGSSRSTRRNRPAADAAVTHDRTPVPSNSLSESGAPVSHDASGAALSARPGTESSDKQHEMPDANNSAPPWHRSDDVRWCLIHDEQDYGITGTRFGSVNQLLESLERTPREGHRPPEAASPSYIFVENPTPANLTRIKKQILFRALAHPTTSVVGYDAKVLKLLNPTHPVSPWHQFELFRFNSFEHEFLQNLHNLPQANKTPSSSSS